MTFLERHNTSQDPDFQRRVKIAALMIAGDVITGPALAPPSPTAAPDVVSTYEMHMAQRQFASRVAADPDGFTPRLSLAVAAMSPVNKDSSDTELLQAMEALFEVYRG